MIQNSKIGGRVSNRSRCFGLPELALAMLVSTGCYSMTSFATLDRAMPTFNGGPISTVVSYLGYPSGEYETMGKKVYVWSTAFTSYSPSTTTTTGTVGTTPVTVTTTSPSGNAYNLACTIKVITSRDVVQSFEYEGNNGACARFSRALKSRAPAARE